MLIGMIVFVVILFYGVLSWCILNLGSGEESNEKSPD
jgi:hypothetical protein